MPSGAARAHRDIMSTQEQARARLRRIFNRESHGVTSAFDVARSVGRGAAME